MSPATKAQLNTSADFKRQVYDREYTFGLVGHSRGYTINGRYLKHVDGFNKEGFEIDLAKLRHPKEVRTPSQFFSNSRGFVYNRINTFYTARVGYARERILYDKTDQGTVSISMVGGGGLSLGLLKPVYIQLYRADSPNQPTILVTERYDPPTHLSATIYGEANFFKGFGEINVRPGIYGKFGVNFDYDLLDKKVTSLESGIVYDFFFTEVPIFYEDPNGEDINLSGFFQLYIAINFGYKKN